MSKGNLRYAVLGLISSKSDGTHGYRLKGECEAIADEFWSLNYGRLYRMLDELEKEWKEYILKWPTKGLNEEP